LERVTGSPACHDSVQQRVTCCAWNLAFRFNRAAQGAHGAAQLVFRIPAKLAVVQTETIACTADFAYMHAYVHQ
jgi:hypothetical protein